MAHGTYVPTVPPPWWPVVEPLLDELEQLPHQALPLASAAGALRRARAPVCQLELVAGEWDPWLELSRRTHLELVWRDFPRSCPAQLVRPAGLAWRLLDVKLATWLGWGQMWETLTHELVHDERELWPLLMADEAAAEVEEALVRAITAERLAGHQ